MKKEGNGPGTSHNTTDVFDERGNLTFYLSQRAKTSNEVRYVEEEKLDEELIMKCHQSKAHLQARRFLNDDGAVSNKDPLSVPLPDLEEL